MAVTLQYIFNNELIPAFLFSMMILIYVGACCFMVLSGEQDSVPHATESKSEDPIYRETVQQDVGNEENLQIKIEEINEPRRSERLKQKKPPKEKCPNDDLQQCPLCKRKKEDKKKKK